MNTHPVLRFGFLTLLVSLVLHAVELPAGRPLAPQRSSPGRRQANMIVLRFQDALAADRWEEALSFCSERVKGKAKEWASPKEFFTDTMPLESVLAQDFGCWSCGDKFYGMVINFYSKDAGPQMQWFWGVEQTRTGWVVDYPPVKMEDYWSKRKAAMEERDTRLRDIRRVLDVKAQMVSTRLTAVSERFTLGKPMVFRLEVVNEGKTPVHYTAAGVTHYGLTITDEGKNPVPFGAGPAQVMERRSELAAGATAVLGEAMDINQHRAITKPGKYTVQFTSENVRIGQPVPMVESGLFGENLEWNPGGFVAGTNHFPSNGIEIEVMP